VELLGQPAGRVHAQLLHERDGGQRRHHPLDAVAASAPSATSLLTW
jgi:hypothetical protein